MKNYLINIIDAIKNEDDRQKSAIELIASENFTSDDIKRACGSSLTNKYAEGYPEQSSIDEFIAEYPDYVHTGNVGRYYGGCKYIDKIELYARYLFKKAFKTNYHVNVQPHSGSSANMAAYMAVLNPGDTILALSLENGGHLTHGSKVSFSGKLYNVVIYGVDENGFIDYAEMFEKALEYRPKLILAGASAYSRIIDFNYFKKVAKKVGALFMVDMAHIAGLVVAGVHPSPFGLADIVTTTTHKTLRGARGGLIFCKPELAKKIDSAVFPGIQGGALQNIIAGKAITAEEACMDGYKQYICQVVENTKAMCNEFIKLGYDVVTGGTDNHLFLIDLTKTHPHLSGRAAQDVLEQYGITVNKNCVPNETRSPKEASGIRIGLAAMTTRGWEREDSVACAQRMNKIISDAEAALKAAEEEALKAAEKAEAGCSGTCEETREKA